jgi:predicted ATP-dependent Lon-type protease
VSVLKEVTGHLPLDFLGKMQYIWCFKQHYLFLWWNFYKFNAEFLCGFAENTGMISAYMAEFCGVMRAIEIAQ